MLELEAGARRQVLEEEFPAQGSPDLRPLIADVCFLFWQFGIAGVIAGWLLVRDPGNE